MLTAVRTAAALLAATLTAAVIAPATALAQAYPAKTVRLVLPFAAGSAVDALGRYYAQRMAENWKQQVVVDNRTGANGIIGTEIAARSPADGYTLYLGNVATLAINPHLYAKLPYDVPRDFAPVSLIAVINNCLVVHPSLPVRSVRDLLALAKARPGQLNYASGGVGSAQHIPMEMLKSMTGANIVHVAYKGLTPAFNDVVAGQVPMMVSGLVTALPLHRAGRLRILALTGDKRSSAVPEVPTMAEAGVAGYDFDSWTGMLAPADTPADIVARLNAELVRITRQPETHERLPGFEWVGGSPQEFADHIRKSSDRIGKVVRDAGIKAE
ncbi:MAG TPA: tripartite tricarboxylate transporter substrate binding protein [Burkholderiales bacterium]|nr:tripartite tricarboxylate transporter substrate binding protein [Burkholderiales bacterium]